MGKKKSDQETTPVVNVAPQVTTDNEQKKPVVYVVVREGFRVSDKEYSDSTDPVAVSEKEFWTTVAKKHSYGEPVEIVQYDAKKHRVW
jgi:hypothetical protein